MMTHFDPETYIVPENVTPREAAARQFANGLEVTAWFLHGLQDGKRDIVTIGKIGGATWSAGVWLYELLGCLNMETGAYVALEYELTPTEAEDWDALDRLMQHDERRAVQEE